MVKARADQLKDDYLVAVLGRGNVSNLLIISIVVGDFTLYDCVFFRDGCHLVFREIICTTETKLLIESSLIKILFGNFRINSFN